jgi:hypothetical protein
VVTGAVVAERVTVVDPSPCGEGGIRTRDGTIAMKAKQLLQLAADGDGSAASWVGCAVGTTTVYISQEGKHICT